MSSSPGEVFESLIQAVTQLHTITGARIITVPIHPRVEGSPYYWLYNDCAAIVNVLLRTRSLLPGYVTVPHSGAFRGVIRTFSYLIS